MRHTGVAIVVALCGVSAVVAPAWGQLQVYSGMCDASAGIASESQPGCFFVANDEDQGEVALRLYSVSSIPPAQARSKSRTFLPPSWSWKPLTRKSTSRAQPGSAAISTGSARTAPARRGSRDRTDAGSSPRGRDRARAGC